MGIYTLSVSGVCIKTLYYTCRVKHAVVASIFLLLTSCFLLLTSNFLPLARTLSDNNYAHAEEIKTPASYPLERAIQLLNDKKLDDALKSLEDSVLLSPNDPQPYYYMGVVYHLKRQHGKAVIALNKALSIQPDMQAAILRIGIVLEEMGKSGMARDAYVTLTESGKENEFVNEAKVRLKKLTSREHFKTAMQFYQKKEYENALKELEMVASITPEDAEVHFAIGMIYPYLKKPKEAIESFKKTIEINPDHVKAYLQLGQVYEITSEYEDAIKSFRKVISIAPESQQAKEAKKRLDENEKRSTSRKQFELVAELIRKELWQDALTELKKVLDTEPNNPNALFNLGLIRHALKDNDAAIEALTHATEIDPNLQKAFYQLGVIYDDNGQYKEATQMYEKVLSIDDKSAEAGKARERIELLSTATIMEETAGEVKELLKNKDIAGAIKEVEGLLAIKKDNTKLLMTLAALYLRENRPKDVPSILERILILTPKDTKVRFYLGNVYEGLGEYEKAAAEYSEVALQGNETPRGKEAETRAKKLSIRAHYERGKTYISSGGYEAALYEMKAIIDLSQDEPIALFNIGVLYDRLGQQDDAVAPLQKALILVPDYIQAHFQLGLVFEKLRKFDESKEAFKKVIEIQKEGKEANIARGRINSLKEYEELTKHIQEGIRFMENREWEKARKEIEAILADNPRNYIGYYYLGIVLDRAGILDEAKVAFKKAIEINPSYGQSYLRFGDLLYREGEFEEARRNYQQVVIVSKDSPEAEVAADRLKKLKAWWGSFSMHHGYNTNVAFRAKAQSIANSSYNFGLSYFLLRQKEWDISAIISSSETVYYETQFKGNAYSVALDGTRNFLDKYILSGSGTYSASYFEGKPTVVSTNFSGNAGTNPGGIPTSASLAYSFSNTRSFVNKLSNSNQHNLSLSLSQKMSARDSLSSSYGFSVYQNLDPIASNYANRTHAISLSYGHHFFSFLDLTLGYSISFINYSNPDSTTLFQRYRSNVNEGMNGGLSISFTEDVSLSFSYTFSYAINRTNLPPLSAEEQQKLEELLSTPLPTVGGGGGYTAHNAGVSLSVRF